VGGELLPAVCIRKNVAAMVIYCMLIEYVGVMYRDEEGFQVETRSARGQSKALFT